jgi:nitrogen regulatory protein PII
MKRIEAVIRRSALDDFQRCAKELGIFGFDLSEEQSRICGHQRREMLAQVKPVSASRLKVDFAILDEQINPTIHAVLEAVHPESIAIFKLDRVTLPPATGLQPNRA